VYALEILGFEFGEIVLVELGSVIMMNVHSG